MATPPPPPSADLQLHPPRFPQIPLVKLETPSTPPPQPSAPSPASTPIPAPSPSPSPAPPPPAPTPTPTVTIPSHSRWFSLSSIHPTEHRLLPDFFSPSPSPSRNPDTYRYFRDAIVRHFRANPDRKLSFTDARRRLIGDVGSIRRVFDFLEAWGLINYVPVPPAGVRREEERKPTGARICGSCKTACSLACFVTDKIQADFILCTRCYVRGNYRPGLSSSDFKRVDIIEETKTEWTDKETLHLLEAVLQYGEDWKKVVEHVGSRSERECIARFIKLPFGEQFLRPEEGKADSRQSQRNDQVSAENGETNVEEPCSPKRRRLTPLADASHPIMAQVALLSAMVGSEVAEAASQAAIAALHEVELGSVSGTSNEAVEETSPSNNQNDVESLKEVIAEAQSQLEKEQEEVEQSISDIVEVQMKEIQEKLVHFEEAELLLEKERLQLSYMKDLLFVDQLSILQHKARLKSSPDRDDDKIMPTENIA